MAIIKYEPDLKQYQQDRKTADELFDSFNQADPLDPIDITDSELLQSVGDVAQQMLSGRIPEDVQAEIERITAERGINSGLGMGQAARNLTARDLGLTSIDIQQRGIGAATAVEDISSRLRIAEADINTRREQFNSEMDLKWSAFREELRQWDDKFSSIMATTDINIEQQHLAVVDLISTNQRYLQGLLNDLIINNSQKKINQLQQNIDELTEFFFETNTAIRDIFDI